nr:hypothetical protein [Pseudomonas sp. IPO3775]
MCDLHNKNEPNTRELLEGLPKNWGKWGPDDEVGALNYLTEAEVLRGVASVRQGKTFTLQVQIGHPDGDPMWPARTRRCASIPSTTAITTSANSRT